jgi:hypothetical protein
LIISCQESLRIRTPNELIPEDPGLTCSVGIANDASVGAVAVGGASVEAAAGAAVVGAWATGPPQADSSRPTSMMSRAVVWRACLRIVDVLSVSGRQRNLESFMVPSRGCVRKCRWRRQALVFVKPNLEYHKQTLPVNLFSDLYLQWKITSGSSHLLLVGRGEQAG